MNILGKDAEQALIDYMDQLRTNPQQWRALHFHFSALQPQNRQAHHIQTITNILQAELGQYTGAAYICRDGDLIIIFEHAAASALETMMTDFRFLFADDPLASAAYVSGQQDGFYTSYDLSISFDQFFYMCLHKLAMVKQEQQAVEKAATPEQPVLPPVAVFQKIAQTRNDRKQLKILVVEDSYFSRQMIRQALLPKHEVILAKDGWEGLALYLNHAPNITFLDIDMPQMNGHEVLHKIIGYDPHPFVIMLTASNLSNDIKHAVAQGAKGYIVKPFTVAKLTAYVEQFCRENNRPISPR